MTVSVCMATYNGERYVVQQLESILAQLTDDDEVCVVDDCSSDATVRAIEDMGDPRIIVTVNDRNEGEVYSFSRALLSARNDILFLSDQDDDWVTGRVALMRERLFQSGASVVSSNFSWMNEDGEAIEVQHDGVRSVDSRRHLRNIFDIFVGKTNYFGCAMALRQEFVRVVAPIPAFVESHDLWIALASNLVRANVHLDGITLRKRLHSNNVTRPVSTRKPHQKLWSRAVFALSLVMLCWRARRYRLRTDRAA